MNVCIYLLLTHWFHVSVVLCPLCPQVIASTKHSMGRDSIEFVLGIDQVVKGFDRGLMQISIGQTHTPHVYSGIRTYINLYVSIYIYIHVCICVSIYLF